MVFNYFLKFRLMKAAHNYAVFFFCLICQSLRKYGTYYTG
ncbi:hypothetical protein DSOL_1781 [Desulfosporosinus metallidurans]|uniref:Uncharacterized protein n=1 Tax=Desulfosporosinus metallidurans TaxID=1888891 RepID=A0A1Q8QXZ8_9FIRM|nr:hypothetical protein DSOL_1781 [Desulfosporosinus metallidurans]